MRCGPFDFARIGGSSSIKAATSPRCSSTGYHGRRMEVCGWERVSVAVNRPAGLGWVRRADFNVGAPANVGPGRGERPPPFADVVHTFTHTHMHTFTRAHVHPYAHTPIRQILR